MIEYVGIGSFMIEEDSLTPIQAFYVARPVLRQLCPDMQNIVFENSGDDDPGELLISFIEVLHPDSCAYKVSDEMESALSGAVDGLGDFTLHVFSPDRR